MNKQTRIWSLALTIAFASGCGLTPDSMTEDASEADLIGGRAGAVFTLSNDPSDNQVLAYRRAADGTLQFAAAYSTTGKGSGDGLGSQGALTFSRDRRYLFAVSAGSNELAAFRVNGEALKLVGTVATGGVRPVSVTESKGIVYVLHAGEGANDISGFRVRSDGKLTKLPGSTHGLSGASTAPAQVSFGPSGRSLVVTEKATNKIDEFRLDEWFMPAKHAVHDSSGQTPFGFAVDERGHAVVSEAFGGAAGASAVSSYGLGWGTGFSVVSPSVKNGEGAACWVALAGERAFVSNTASDSISIYAVAKDGKLEVTARRAFETGSGSKPADMAVSRDERYLYVLEGGTRSLGVARIEKSGTLTPLADVPGLPAAAAGLAAE